MTTWAPKKTCEDDDVFKQWFGSYMVKRKPGNNGIITELVKKQENV